MLASIGNSLVSIALLPQSLSLSRGHNLILVGARGAVICISHRLSSMSRSLALLARHILQRILTELHLEHLLDHLIENGARIVRRWKLTCIVSHIDEELSEGLDHFLLLWVLAKVLLTILDHVLNLLHHYSLVLHLLLWLLLQWLILRLLRGCLDRGARVAMVFAYLVILADAIV